MAEVCGDKRGTPAGYMRHYRSGGKACPDCLAANREYQRGRRTQDLCIVCKKYAKRPKLDTCEICSEARRRARARARHRERRLGAPARRARSSVPPGPVGETEQEKARRYRLWDLYRLTPERWEYIFNSQGRRCAIEGCQTTVPGGNGTFHVDHDHTCCPGKKSCGSCIRGLLCARCNTLLGWLRDDVNLIDSMSAYLRYHEARLND